MAEWTHNICLRCWKRTNPVRQPIKVEDGEIETCCFCGKDTKAGIYIRHNPNKLSCVHED